MTQAQRERLRERVARAAKVVPTRPRRRRREPAAASSSATSTRRSTCSTRRATPTTLRDARSPRAGPHALVTGPAGDPARPRPGALVATSGAARRSRCPSRCSSSSRCFGLSLGRRDPVRVRRVHDRRDARASSTRSRTRSRWSRYVTNLVELIGLGLAIDYSLLVVHRFREELGAARVVGRRGRRGRWRPPAAPSSSPGSPSAIGPRAAALRAGAVRPLDRRRRAADPARLDRGGADAAAGAPALAPRRAAPAAARARDVDRGFWARLARSIMRRPRACTRRRHGAPARRWRRPRSGCELTPGSFSAIPSATESMRGFALLRDARRARRVTPIARRRRRGRARRRARRRARARPSTARRRRLPRPRGAASSRAGGAPPYVDPTGRYARVVVVGRHEYGARRRAAVRAPACARELVPRARFPEGARVYAGGAPPQGVDFLDRSYGAFPWLVARRARS